MYMHIEGRGDPVKLAAAVNAGLHESQTPLSDAPSGGNAPSTSIDVETSKIDKALGHKGKVNGGVYQVSIPREEKITEADVPVPAAMASAIAINFQPTGNGKAAITGDFVLVASEVNPVLRALRNNGIEVTALHSHMLNEEPRLFFMHFWANDDVEKLAHGLGAALDRIHLASG